MARDSRSRISDNVCIILRCLSFFEHMNYVFQAEG